MTAIVWLCYSFADGDERVTFLGSMVAALNLHTLIIEAYLS